MPATQTFTVESSVSPLSVAPLLPARLVAASSLVPSELSFAANPFNPDDVGRDGCNAPGVVTNPPFVEPAT